MKDIRSKFFSFGVDPFKKSSLIWVCTVWLCNFVRNFGVLNFRRFTNHILFKSLEVKCPLWVLLLVFPLYSGTGRPDWLCWGLTKRQPLCVILCPLPEIGRKAIEEIVEMKEKDRRKRNRNENEETEEIETFLLYPYLLQGQQALSNYKPRSVGRLGDERYTTPLPHLTNPLMPV